MDTYEPVDWRVQSEYMAEKEQARCKGRGKIISVKQDSTSTQNTLKLISRHSLL